MALSNGGIIGVDNDSVTSAKVTSFTSSGTFDTSDSTANLLIVAGGGGGCACPNAGGQAGGGAGAGGVLYNSATTRSPSSGAISLPASPVPVTILSLIHI